MTIGLINGCIDYPTTGIDECVYKVQNPISQIASSQLQAPCHSSKKFSASKIDSTEPYKNFPILPGTFQNYFINIQPFCAGSIKLIYEGFNEAGKPVIISEFRSWQRPDGESVGEDWATLYSTDKEIFEKAKTVPGIVPLYDHLEYVIPEGVRQFVVSERCECDLMTFWAKSQGPLLDFANQLIHIVKSAHDNHLVINDLTLNNLLVKEGKIYLSDLDLLYAHDSDSPKNNKTLGTVDFLPPESFCLGEVQFDPYKKDLWALGIALAYLMDSSTNKKASRILSETLQLDAIKIFSNKEPSKTKNLSSSLRLLRFNNIQKLSCYAEAFKRRFQKFYDASHFAGGISPIVGKLMNADPARRYQTIDELLSDWNKYYDTQALDDSASLSTSDSDESVRSEDM